MEIDVQLDRNPGQGTWKIYLPAFEALAVYTAALTLPRLTPHSIWAWQITHLQCTPLNHLLLFFWLPLAICFVCLRSPAALGISFYDIKPQLRIGIRSAIVISMFAAIPIGLLVSSGFGYASWESSIILGLLEIPAILFLTRLLAPVEQPNAVAPSRKAAMILAMTPVLAIAAMAVLAPISQKTSHIVFVFILTGLGEELFYRGYLQSRFNAVFGRPYMYQGISWGPGLILAAILFGLSHPLFRGGHDWPWAIWTAAIGITFGIIREKANSVLPAALAHALLDVPLVFFG